MYPNLKLQIWRLGIHQNRLARMLGIDETALSRIVNGFREPGKDVRARIADLLQSDEGWLFQSDSDSCQRPLSNRRDEQVR